MLAWYCARNPEGLQWDREGRVDLLRSRIVNIEDVVFMQHLASNPLGLTESCDNYATL